MPARQARIGVFVCHCGSNIAGTVDVDRVVEELRRYPGVVHAEDYLYMCSEPGQQLMRRAIREHRLDGVVNANCSPTLHERTFRQAAAAEGLNPYRVEIANIREQCSWPHLDEPEKATGKAIAIVKAAVEKLRLNLALEPMVTPLTRRALVIGAGPAGVQAALDIAAGGYEVVLVEREPYIGGHASRLAGTYPSLELPRGLLAERLAAVVSNPRIRLYTYSEVEEVAGYVGNFVVSVRRRARYIDAARCDGCGLCLERCPVEVPSEFDRGLTMRRAVRLPVPGSTPFVPVIDATVCRHFTRGDCQACREVCPGGAIDFAAADEVVTEEVGTIVAAPGYDLLPPERTATYPADPDIVDGLQFERLLAPDGPTGGEVRRPSDGTVPRQVVFISCVGSRDPEYGVPYCSRVCCMYVARQAVQYRRAVPDGTAYIFYTDLRADALGYEEFVQAASADEGIIYIRGKVGTVGRQDGYIRVQGRDDLLGKDVIVRADLVVLARAMVPHPSAGELSRRLNIAVDAHGFLSEAHIKLRPVESLTSGIYLAGAAQWPRDLPDTIASADAAASKVLSLFSRRRLLHEPVVAEVEVETCTGCAQCVAACAYRAVSLDERRQVAEVNQALCEGCGACAVACPSKAMTLKNWTPRQFLAMIEVAAG